MVELRLDAMEEAGMPQECFVSVRIGDTQKLSRLSASRVYRFPKAGDRRYGKIEVFRRIGACNVDVDPSNADLREVSINCAEAGFGTLGLKVAVAGETKTEADPAEAKKEGHKVKAAKEYLSKHGLEVRLSEAMQAVLRERPADPAEFLAGKLMETRDRVGGIKLPALKPTGQEDSGPAMPAKQSAPQAAESEPQKSAARPQKLEPLQKSAAPAAAATTAVLPFKDFYKANFGRMGNDAFAKCYSKFPSKISKKAQAPAPAPAPAASKMCPYLKPSIGTWLCTIPPSVNKAAAGAPAAAAANTAAAAFKLKPSVGTWLKRPPRAMLQQAKTEAKAEAPTYKTKASVATWLKPLPKAAAAAQRKEEALRAEAQKALVDGAASGKLAKALAGAQQAKETKPNFGHKPSVGTWLARPAPALRPPEAPKPCFATKPSVGTWMFPGFRPAPPPAKPKPMMMSSMARCGPAFASFGLAPGVMFV